MRPRWAIVAGRAPPQRPELSFTDRRGAGSTGRHPGRLTPLIVRKDPMSRIVQKYGGSSVADAESIKRVARKIARAKQRGDAVTVVISAMGDTTCLLYTSRCV